MRAVDLRSPVFDAQSSVCGDFFEQFEHVLGCVTIQRSVVKLWERLSFGLGDIEH